jgi:hypothetical protein
VCNVFSSTNIVDRSMKTLVFTEGTLIMHSGARGLSREETVKQVQEGKNTSIYEYKNYVPVGNSARKLHLWKNQGAEIVYLTSRMKPAEVEEIMNVLKKHGFPDGQLLFRGEGEEYKDVAERAMPNVIVEDDCESIGGESEMTYTHVEPELKKGIKSVAVKEFGGIGHLPDSIFTLKT